jgi:hypothetical protein
MAVVLEGIRLIGLVGLVELVELAVVLEDMGLAV